MSVDFSEEETGDTDEDYVESNVRGYQATCCTDEYSYQKSIYKKLRADLPNKLSAYAKPDQVYGRQSDDPEEQQHVSSGNRAERNAAIAYPPQPGEKDGKRQGKPSEDQLRNISGEFGVDREFWCPSDDHVD